MEESHRLVPMQEYDPAIFNELYKKTTNLRNSLVFGIDSRKYGVDPDELKSWFDIKFIYVFNKYYEKGPELLLGHLINALKTYKMRLVRSSYHEKFNLHSQSVNLEDVQLEDHQDIKDDTHEYKYELIMKFLADHISDDALFLLELELNTPRYIQSKLEDLGKNNLKKIPLNLILEYLEIEENETNLNWIRGLREEVNIGIAKCKNYFSFQRA